MNTLPLLPDAAPDTIVAHCERAASRERLSYPIEMKTATLSFAKEHPAFPGHFPGRPIVPGVLLLDGAQREIERMVGCTLTGIAAAKFLSPAVPDEILTMEFEQIGGAVTFTIRCDTRIVANGRFRLASEATP